MYEALNEAMDDAWDVAMAKPTQPTSPAKQAVKAELDSIRYTLPMLKRDWTTRKNVVLDYDSFLHKGNKFLEVEKAYKRMVNRGLRWATIDSYSDWWCGCTIIEKDAIESFIASGILERIRALEAKLAQLG